VVLIGWELFGLVWFGLVWFGLAPMLFGKFGEAENLPDKMHLLGL